MAQDVRTFTHRDEHGTVERMGAGYFVTWVSVGMHETSIADNAPIRDAIDPIIAEMEQSQ